MTVDRYEERWDVASERLVALPARLETSTWFSPVTTTITQGALAVNGLNIGGSQTALAANLAVTTVSVS
jgi:hypothetical protein